MASQEASATTRFCSQCGKPLLASDRFCPYCGLGQLPHLRPTSAAISQPTPKTTASAYSSDILSGAAALVIGLIAFGGFYFWSSSVKSSKQPVAPVASSAPISTPPTPSLTPTPPPVQVSTLSEQERTQAQQELQPLLGDLYYPGAELPPEFAARVGRTYREGKAGSSPLYPSIALLAPASDSLENVVAYYQHVAPGGTSEPQGGYRADHIPRPGDQVPVRVLVVRPEKGPNVGRIVIMLMTFR